ncbi:MAG: DUF5615 family PIN-like protein [Pseudonocardia sp.]|nr:DUF5615 family PIN-like protein [Pseudonocardia sp.]
MKFLLDQNLSPRVAVLLRAGGLHAEHVRDYGLQTELDEVILVFARDNGFVLVSEDTDFGELLARQRTSTPSFVPLRTNGPMSPDQHAALLLRNILIVLDELAEGAVVVIGEREDEDSPIAAAAAVA